MSLVQSRNTGRMANSIYETLRERLVSGGYAQGSRISVEALRTELSVSKQPVMEALRLLSADGLVDIIPQVGCVTSVYPVREIADFYDMFAGFEGAIAAAAAERRVDAQLYELEEISIRIGTLRSHPDPDVRARQYRVLNRDFHAKIHEMSGSRIMVETSRRMWDLSDFLINTAGASQPLASATHSRHDDHEEIRRAIIAGDSLGAREAMARHILETIDLIRNDNKITD
ncbi:GntR family transcriptional regulator [Microbacterium pumilum]|uniref:GntR family transcriptional regulator n=1 Tax=Microbacterium pumilum TaxID=344165 RepID=A0ABP5EEM3_9MICO